MYDLPRIYALPLTIIEYEIPKHIFTSSAAKIIRLQSKSEVNGEDTVFHSVQC